MRIMTRRVNARNPPGAPSARGRGSRRGAPRHQGQAAFRGPRRGSGSPWQTTRYQPVTITLLTFTFCLQK